jgi:hypothetical protein
MHTKWASCSRSGTLTFSLDLLGESRFFGEHVIVHELLHLMVPNHGQLFRSLLRTYVPEADEQLDPESRDGSSPRKRQRRMTDNDAGTP